MNKNQEYIEHLKVEEVPWHRITTTYGRATDFPQYFKIMWDMENITDVKTALCEVTNNIEHQSTLWHATPFAMIFLKRIFERAVSEINQNECADYIVDYLLEFFELIAECFLDGDDMEHPQQLEYFSDMVKEKYLLSEEYDEEEDEIYYEDEEVFSEELFYSFWYYSYQVAAACRPMLKKLENSSSQHWSVKAKELHALLNC